MPDPTSPRAATPLWTPSAERVARSNLAAFARRYTPEASDYGVLHRWSLEEPEVFWSAVWEFAGALPTLEPGEHLPVPRAFPPAPRGAGEAGPSFNFAENLLRHRDERTALVFWNERGRQRELSHAALYREVARMAAALEALGIGPGDRVAGWLPNLPETVIAMLASAALGATWSSCSPDFGTHAVVERLGQIAPRVLFAADGYLYAGKEIDCTERLAEIARAIPSLERVVVVPYLRGAPDVSRVPLAVLWDEFAHPEAEEIAFRRLPFDHPLYVLYSSGTTGLPKGIVHGAGGTLVQHLKELVLHTDLRREDRIFYYTTCGWMMWNWLVSALAVGAAVVLWDGAPMAPTPEALWAMAEVEGVSVFGTSAKYLALLEKEGIVPGERYDLPALRAVLSTGSPLAPHTFDYVYERIKRDVHLASISGGTDIVSCFVLGVPTLPVWRGEIQAPGLGMAVEVWDDAGQRVIGEPGELVCTKPFPSMPVGFWNDPAGERYRAAYFEHFPGTWRHGDWVEETERGGFIIYGRSDATLNPGGVRIGTAEIYRQVEQVEEVIESVAIAEETGPDAGDVRIALFVRLRPGLALDDALRGKIRRRIREHTSPHHVPKRIEQVPDIPRTISGKISEIAVREVAHGRPVKNTAALANPEALGWFDGRIRDSGFGIQGSGTGGRGSGGYQFPETRTQCVSAIDTGRLRCDPTDDRQPTTDSPLRALLSEIVDYAGLFPPARLAMEPAVARYAEALASPAAWMLGRFVVPLARLTEFESAAMPYAESMERSPWRLSALGAGESETELSALEDFNRRWAGRARMDTLETPISTIAEIERVRRALPVGVTAYLELPVEADPTALVAAVGAAGLRAKIRTGGITPEAFPSPAEVLRFLVACARLGVPFKATAGLHHPLRAEYALTYEPDAPRGVMFGYLNVFLAAALLRAGEAEALAAEMLVESDPAALRVEANGLRWRNHLLDAEMLRQARQSFAVSFGSCSFDEPVEGMVGIRGQSSRDA